jgi:hypothetical protein
MTGPCTSYDAGLSKQWVVVEAVGLPDREGVDGLSMRGRDVRAGLQLSRRGPSGLKASTRPLAAQQGGEARHCC